MSCLSNINITVIIIKFRTSPLYCFRLFPILIGTVVGIIVCVIFTVTDTFPEDDASRTDNDRAATGIQEAPWIFFPYPCKLIFSLITSRSLEVI